MNDVFEKRQSGLQGVVIAVVVAAVVLALLGSTIDAVESFWETTRRHELWELDEILLGIALAPAAGLVVALIKIRQLNRRLTVLETGGPPVRRPQRAATRVPGAETIVKCTYCAKYKSEDETWLGDEDYLSHRCEAAVVAGVCPSCRQGAPSKPA